MYNVKNTMYNLWMLASIFIGFCYITLGNAQGSEPTIICYQDTINNSIEFSLDNASDFISTVFYNASRNTTFLTSGYSVKAVEFRDKIGLQDILNLKDRSVCQLQWDYLANTGFSTGPTGINYPVVIANAKLVADRFAKAISGMRDKGLNLSMVHLIGHSIGAHVMGNAGKSIQDQTNELVALVIALDPASFGYQGLLTTSRLGTTSGKFVWVLHSDRAGYGNKDLLGHVDVFLNDLYYETNGVEPGCPKWTIPLSPDDFCSHKFSLALYKSTIGHPYSLKATQADNITAWTNNIQGRAIYVGDLIDTTARGKYYVCTKGVEPVGMGEDGVDPSKCYK